ncbi:MAG: AAA family ATPase [Bellilinea sp.]
MHILAFGPPEVRLGEDLVTFPTRKTQALMFYLAIEAGQQTRAHLASLLWPESSPERSYASLRNTLSRLQTALRQASGQAQVTYLSITNTTLGLNPDGNIDLDLNVIERAYALANTDPMKQPLSGGAATIALLQSAVASQRGEFLAGFSLGDAPGFDDWVSMQRESWHRRLILILDRLSENQFTRGEFSDASETVSRWIALDTLNEAAYRRKMRVHFAAGERGKALETYDACRAMLATELGIEPEPDTDALADRIRTQISPVHSRKLQTADLPQRADTSVDFLGSLFAGRKSETQTLVNCYELAAAGQPQLVILRGEAGIGKTRLAKRFLAWANAQGAELLHGGAFESRSHFPYQPLVDAIRLRLEGKSPSNGWLDEGWLSTLGQFLPEFRQDNPDISRTAKGPRPLKSELIQSQLFESLVQLTLALAKRAPLVMLVDDLQWADSATLDLLHYAVRRWRESAAVSTNARVMLLVSLRSEALHPMTQPQQGDEPPGLIQWLSRVEREVTPVHLELDPLGEDETEQMVLSILSPPSPEFAQKLYAATHGHPYYLIETLKDFLERRVLRPKRQAKGQWAFAVNAESDFGQAIHVPSTIHMVIRSRLNRLSPGAFNLLAGGAVFEQQLTFEHLLAISTVNEEAALPALDELISGRLLLEVGEPGTTSEYTFVNDMLRDVVYTEAGEARRRLFHRRALEILETEGSSAAVLAHHAVAAGLMQDAFRHSLAAGREALRLSAVSEAIVHFERALQFVQEKSLPEMPEEADLRELYLQLARVYELASQTEKASALDAERDKLTFKRKDNRPAE